MKLKDGFFILIFSVFVTTSAFAWSPTQVRRIYAKCVSLMHLTPARRAALAKKEGMTAQLPAVVRSCNVYLAKGLPRVLQLEQEYDDWEHGRGRFSGGGGFGGSLDCLSNEHFVDGNCEPKDLDRCDSGADCAFGESCSAGVCS